MRGAAALGWASAILAVSACTLVGYPGHLPAPAPVGEAPPTGSGGGGPAVVGASAGGGGGADLRSPPDFRRDRPPTNPSDVDLDTISDAVPVAEPRARYGNMAQYEAMGRTYRTLSTSVGYQAEGTASWYGEEFHGRRTSSGEPYDMYAMTAAHPTLPLPTYVEVVNLDNGRRVVVRVNDRGPFHADRIIDVSYAAAHRLAMIGRGTARVRIRALQPG